jgi:hypothetical protein
LVKSSSAYVYFWCGLAGRHTARPGGTPVSGAGPALHPVNAGAIAASNAAARTILLMRMNEKVRQVSRQKGAVPMATVFGSRIEADADR